MDTGPDIEPLAVEGDWVYWIDRKGGAIGRAAVDGAIVELGYFQAADFADLSAITADGDRLAWTLAHDVGGGEVDFEVQTATTDEMSVTTAAAGMGPSNDVQIIGADVLWAGTAALREVPFVGGDVGTLAVVAPGTWAFVVTGSDAYSTNVVDPGLYRSSVGGAELELLVPGTRPEGCVADSTHVYWTDAGEGSIYRILIE